MKRNILAAFAATLLLASGYQSDACTNLIVGKQASVDGSVICTYNCDSFGLAKPLSYYPAGKHDPSEMVAIFPWKREEMCITSRRPPTPMRSPAS